MKTTRQYELTDLAMVGPDEIPVFLIPSATPDKKLNQRREQERAYILETVNSYEELLKSAKNVIEHWKVVSGNLEKAIIACFFISIVLIIELCTNYKTRKELDHLQRIHTATIEACGEAWLKTPVK